SPSTPTFRSVASTAATVTTLPFPLALPWESPGRRSVITTRAAVCASSVTCVAATWPTAHVAATQVTDDAQTAARVVITLRRPGDSHGKAKGNGSVVTVAAVEATERKVGVEG